ncbi:DUF1116 domain-containing protein [Amantichitinum ursilacus]|uniref:Membrane protein FdrA n=1 Tax=Amantichitinum ursilacus TaxID=857265 RepID=A0A0N0XGV3_9NEIS|nr:DUF1116 domain-containing protein [Amantichitinum ursilacus]KPC50243.1 hypothetical protein WG78_17740 [Amantichitinum ursilacus]
MNIRTSLFEQPLDVINLGLASFADNLVLAGGAATQLDWQPPALGDVAAGLDLAWLINHPRVEAANQIAFERYLAAQPALIDVQFARDTLPAMAQRKLILHAGPPIAWADMCGPMQGAIVGAAIFEGWADSVEAATALVEAGQIDVEPCHHHNVVGPMAGIVSPSMPLWVIQNTTNGSFAYCNFNEGLGKVLRFGANGPEVLERLHWMTQELAPTLQAALKVLGPLELKPIMAQALHMGDEVHNRNAAATGLLLKRLVPALLRCGQPADHVQRAIEFIYSNDHFFLNLSMAACKAMTDAASGVPCSSMVTVMARNGVNFGIQVSGTGKRWYQAPANPINGLYFPGYSAADATADLGDSAITETAGVGGFAMASSPAIVKFVGGTPADATQNSRRMQSITLGSNPAFTLPALDFAPTAAGVDIRKVVDSGTLPIINTGIAHKLAGVGQIGAGITTAPMPGFIEAIRALAEQVRLADGGAA